MIYFFIEVKVMSNSEKFIMRYLLSVSKVNKKYL